MRTKKVVVDAKTKRIDTVLKKALSTEPEGRYQTVTDFINELRDAFE